MQDREYTEDEFVTIANHAMHEGTEYFFVKGNIPMDMDAYSRGNGEGMWIMIDSATKQDLDRHRREGVFYALLNEFCVYHQALNKMAFDLERLIARPVLFEFRSSRPVLAKIVLEKILDDTKPANCI